MWPDLLLFDRTPRKNLFEHSLGREDVRPTLRCSGRVASVAPLNANDLRCGRTLCASCGKSNPPWGHVNSFDEARLRSLFGTLNWDQTSFVGSSSDVTNAVSATLLDYAGRPFGTWQQEAPCVYCGAPIGRPRERNLPQRVATRAAFLLDRLQASIVKPHANWIHVLFSKPRANASR